MPLHRPDPDAGLRTPAFALFAAVTGVFVAFAAAGSGRGPSAAPPSAPEEPAATPEPPAAVPAPGDGIARGTPPRPAAPPASAETEEEKAASRSVGQASGILAVLGAADVGAKGVGGGLLGGGGVARGTGGLGSRGVGVGGGGHGDGAARGYGKVDAMGTTPPSQGLEGLRARSLRSAPPPPPAATLRVEPVDGPAATETSRAGATALTPTTVDARSTFAADVDTGSYTFARRVLRSGGLPDAGSVRVEEFVNFFRYDYGAPRGDLPLAVDAELVKHPTQPDRHLLRLGVQARRVEATDRKPVRLTFLVDTSGSMRGADRLGMAQRAMARAVSGLGAEDTVAIVTYAGSTRVVLPPVPASQRHRIQAALKQLTAGGSTAMDSGMALAYAQAEASFAEGAENRVIVLSDGDANIGRTSADDMLQTIRRHAEGGITLTTVGFGTGNYQDARMERLADAGDGVYVYIDGWAEAERVFGRQLGATLETVARDVKLQVEFDPAVVTSWRQVGYDNRQIADHDFRDDAVDAGEVGSGHQVTALYEVTLSPQWRSKRRLGEVHLRAKPPGPDRPAREWSERLTTDTFRSVSAASPDTRLAVAAMHLAQGVSARDGAELERAAALAGALARDGRDGAAEVVELVAAAQARLPSPRVRAAPPAVLRGPLDPGRVEAVVGGHLGQLDACYQDARRDRPELAGAVEVRFIVAPMGLVSHSSVRSSTLDSGPVERCVAARFLRMRFPEAAAGESTVVHYPLRFEPT